MQLAAGRSVHCVSSSRDAVLYVSETDNGQDVALVLPPTGIPRATALSSANILAALGESVGGSGTIQSLLLGDNDVVWFYFVGGKGRRLHACVGRFSLVTEALDIFADTDALRAASAMGDALDLARGTLLAGTAEPRLMLRHSDGWILLGCQTTGAKPLVALLQQANLDNQPLPINQDRYDIAAGENDSLLVLDRVGGTLLSVDKAGVVKPLLSLVGVPHELSLPRQREHAVLFFAAESDPFEGEAFDTLHNRAPTTTYPALLTFREGKLTAMGRDALRASGGLNNYSLHIRELIPTAGGDYVAYDSASGAIVKMRWMRQ